MTSQKVLLKLADAVSFSFLDDTEDKSKTGPKIYRKSSLVKLLLMRYLLRLSSDRELIRKMKIFPQIRKACRLKKIPSASTLSRIRNKINLSDIFYHLVGKTKELGLSRGFILSVDSTQFKAYLQMDKEAKIGYCAAKEEFIFGYKAHIVTDAESELPVAIVVTPANEHDSKQFFPLVKRIWKTFTYEIKKILADSGYDSSKIRNFLRKIGVEDVIDRNKRKGKDFGKPKDNDYRKRVSSERVNSRAKDSFVLERFTFCGIRRALDHTYCCLSAMLYSAIGCFLLGFRDWIKSLFRGFE